MQMNRRAEEERERRKKTHLIPHKHTNIPPIEYQIPKEIRTPIIHENALLFIILPPNHHIKHDILQTRRLRHLPMNPRSIPRRRIHGRHVNHKVPDLPVKVVLVRVPIRAAGVVLVGVEQGDAVEGGRAFDDGEVGGVADELRVVEHEQGAGDEVGAGGEVDDARGRGRGVAAGAAARGAVEGAVDGHLDGGRVVGCAVAWLVVLVRLFFFFPFWI